MKLAAPQINAAEEALTRVLAMTQPADAVLHHFFRSHPQLGQHDRAFVAETVYGVLRHRYGLEHATAAATVRRLLVVYFNRVCGVSLRQLAPLLGQKNAEWAATLKASSAATALPLHVAAELPEWLVTALAGSLAADEILALGRALQQPAPFDLRVNPLTATRDQVLAQLAAEDYAAQPTPYSPVGMRLESRRALVRHPLFEAGKIEVQDEGSQLLCYLLAPKRREMVVDFCAGAGGKTLLLGALMHSTGRLYAFDVSATRLSRLKTRLKRSGLSNVYPQLLSGTNDNKIGRLAGKIDRVLVDAPCSGLGTLRRNPDLKFRQSPGSIEELTHKQAAILASASRLLKKGGRLVYATCSILPEENQRIVEAFLAEHPDFTLKPVGEVLQQQKIALEMGDYLELRPQLHGTDGFFAAVMERTGS